MPKNCHCNFRGSQKLAMAWPRGLHHCIDLTIDSTWRYGKWLDQFTRSTTESTMVHIYVHWQQFIPLVTVVSAKFLGFLILMAARVGRKAGFLMLKCIEAKQPIWMAAINLWQWCWELPVMHSARFPDYRPMIVSSETEFWVRLNRICTQLLALALDICVTFRWQFYQQHWTTWR